VDMTIPEGMRLQVVHLHADNSTIEQRENSKYKTIARLFSRETNEVVSEAASRCCKNDTPDRRRGFQVAVGRVLAKIKRNQE